MINCLVGGDCYRNECLGVGRCRHHNEYHQHRQPHESLHCPETGLHCHDPKCSTRICLIKNLRERTKEPVCLSEKQWDELMCKLSANPFNYHSDPKEVEVFLKIVAEQVGIIDRLTRNTEHECHHEGSARYLGVTGMQGTLINEVSFNVKNKQHHMSVSFKKAGGAIATLTAFAADGVTPAPNGVDLTKPITALSNHPDFFTAAIVVDTNGVPTFPLQAKLNGVDDGVGTVTYAATSTDGSAIVLVDNVTVADVPPIVPAASFTVSYNVF